MRYLVGDERLHYFGVSYGAALGAVYAHLYPSHVGRLVLEASVDPTEDLNEEQLSQVKAVQAAFDRFAAHCAARISHCPTGEESEEAARRMARLSDRLEKEPAPAGGGRNLDADDLAYTVSDYLDLGTDGWSPLAKAQRVLGPHRRRHVRRPADRTARPRPPLYPNPSCPMRPRPDATIG
ncbi:pimeloyl-ACP methyl ester carboxylesterase [Streptomyces sp. SAI-195]|uniref:alpha/beta fold hydrolase n=1 Tax=unclassified Streptomyces TaxID=2593676 RepID=UPI0034375E8F